MKNTVLLSLMLAAPIGVGLPFTLVGGGSGNANRAGASAREVGQTKHVTAHHRDLARALTLAAVATAGWPYSFVAPSNGQSPGKGGGVFAGAANTAPVCDAGPDITVERQGNVTIVQMDGSNSYDNEGDPLTFLWTSCPGTLIESPNSAITNISFPSPAGQTSACGVRLKVSDGQKFSLCRLYVTITPTADCVFLILDEDAIDNGLPPNYFSAADVNENSPGLAQRAPLPYFQANVGQVITLWSGTVGDEGWFAPKVIPQSWADAGPTLDGLQNFVGDPCQAYPHNVGPGLGTGSNPETLLDKLPSVIPLRADALKGLEGKCVGAVVWDSDISINYDPIDGSLMGEKLGVVAFKVLDVRMLTGQSSGSLPEVDILILDACTVFNGSLELYLSAIEPTSSSEPYDVDPDN